MDRAAFYAALRARSSAVFATPLSTAEVQGLDAILDEGQRRTSPLGHLAYMLATAYHETAGTMQPIHERGKRSYFDRYEPGSRLGRALGNIRAGDGFAYRGRGFVQLTGRRNYTLAARKLSLDLVARPDLALNMAAATRILFDGMQEGWFTGKQLDDAIDRLDEADAEDLREFVDARRVVNGTDKAEKIGLQALAFEKALSAAGYGVGAAAVPHVLAPDGVPRATGGAQPEPPLLRPAPAVAGIMRRLWRWLLSLLRRKP